MRGRAGVDPDKKREGRGNDRFKVCELMLMQYAE